MKKQEHFFSVFPFGYFQNVVIISGLFSVGVLIEGLFRGSGFYIPSFPYNWIFLVIQVALGVLLSFLPFGKKIKEWVTSVPFVVVSSLFLIVLVLLSGLINQPIEEGWDLKRYLGLSHIVNSWYFVFMFFLVSFSLELTIIKRWQFKTLKDYAFFLNHFGMLVIVLAAFWGASDLKRVVLELRPEELVWNGVDQKNRPIDLPFALKLREFRIDEYSPQIVFVSRHDGKILPFKKVHHAEKNTSFKENNWNVEVLDYQPYVWFLNDKIVFTKQWSSPAGALVKATNLKTNEVKESWVTTQTVAHGPQTIQLDDSAAIDLAMIDGRPKRFSSDIEWFSPNGLKGKVTVEVNKPFALNGWKIYQYGYDDTMGRWSQMTILEAIRDPWLPIVYLGLVLALVGTFLFIWTGKENES